jgi:hypothetical protein
MAVVALNVGVALGICVQGGRLVLRQSPPEQQRDLLRFRVADVVGSRDRGMAVVAPQLDRALLEKAPPPDLDPPTPGSPRPEIRLVAVLDDEEIGQARAAIVAFADGRQRMVLPEGDLDRAGYWQVVKVSVEGPRGVITIEAGRRQERYTTTLSRVGG